MIRTLRLALTPTQYHARCQASRRLSTNPARAFPRMEHPLTPADIWSQLAGKEAQLREIDHEMLRKKERIIHDKEKRIQNIEKQIEALQELHSLELTHITTEHLKVIEMYSARRALEWLAPRKTGTLPSVNGPQKQLDHIALDPSFQRIFNDLCDKLQVDRLVAEASRKEIYKTVVSKDRNGDWNNKIVIDTVSGGWREGEAVAVCAYLRHGSVAHVLVTGQHVLPWPNSPLGYMWAGYYLTSPVGDKP
ncbi:hypothetical protein BDZ91DRAFT_749803 [Kalaharituber pfeilii]|nr:hypothetical protein BDZ91DRAFT_749803 [Kalaharituber pfeilii]